MKTLGKINELHLWKKKNWIILLGMELLLLIWGIAGLFGKSRIYEYGVEEATVQFGDYLQERQGYVADVMTGATGSMMAFEGISLPRGHYVVSLKYETDTDYVNGCKVIADAAGFRGCLANGDVFHAALRETNLDMWLLRDAGPIAVQVDYNAGTLIVGGLTIRETNALNRIYLTVLLFGIALCNSVLLFREYDKLVGVSERTKRVMFGLGVIWIFSSLPLLTDYILESGDVTYHLNRIEGIKDGILSGQFPVRIAPRWLEGNGYASAIFYPEITLLPAAILRMIGFTITTSYRIYMMIMNLITVLVSYYCFSKMFRNEYIGVLCSMLHVLSIYRIFNMYVKGSLGEMQAMVFLPLLVYGFYRVFTQDSETNSYKWTFLPLTVAFAGLIQSHLLTCELVGGFTILLCIILWKKVLRKATFLVLTKTVILSVLISAWFLVPFFDYMVTGNFVIQNVSARTIQERGLYVAHLFTPIPFYGDNTLFKHTGMVETAPVGIGFILLIVILIWLYLWFTKGKQGLKEKGLSGEDINLGILVSVFAIISMVMSLNVFPWDRIQTVNGVLAVLVSSLQFPTRLLTIANIMLVVLAGIIGKYVLVSGKESLVGGFVISICGLTVLTSLFGMNDHLHKGKYMKIYGPSGMGYGYIAGAEYLPYGTDQTRLVFRNPESSENVCIEGFEKGALKVDVNCYNIGSGEGILTMPLLYYKGYVAYDVDTKEELEVFDGENHSVSVKVPEGYSGVICTRFVSLWYWRVAEGITVLTVFGVVLLYRRDKKKGIISCEK